MREWSRGIRLAIVVSAWLPAGCVATKLPLCPQVAQLSYPRGAAPSDVNRFVSDRARERRVRVTPLSTFVAEFRGYVGDVRWLERNYRTLLCAFDSSQVVDDGRLYGACMSNASGWIAVVQSARPEYLMLDKTFFKDTCALPTAPDAAEASAPLQQPGDGGDIGP